MSNCISDITLVGWVVKDPEVFTSQKTQKNFGKITLAVNKSYPNELANFYSCFLDESQLERVQKAGVKKGSLLKITGEFTHRVYEKVDQSKQPTGEKGFDLRVVVWAWDYLPASSKKSESAAPSGSAAPATTQDSTADTGFSGLPVDMLDDDLPF